MKSRIEIKLLATRKSEQNRAVVDPWSAVHLTSGLAMGLMAIPFDRSFGAAVGYELVEQFAERNEWGQEFFETSHPESLPNALFDLAIFAVGHWLGSRWNRTG
jgi:hypothetical protein